MVYSAYLDCHSGISGDMFLAALLDAGLSFEVLKQGLSALPISGYHLTRETAFDKGIKGVHFDVHLDEPEQTVRHFTDIAAMLQNARLPVRVCEIALAIFRCLAEAEAAVHGVGINEVHFHEVGALDAIVDIVGAALGVDALGITQCYASPLPLTYGRVTTSHGLLPVPAPATLEILRRVQAPWVSRSVEGELVTPTGAAILATLARFEMPPLVIERVGYGFGRKHFPWPNCLRLCLGKAQAGGTDRNGEADIDWVTVIEANIDNMSGELIGSLMDRLFQAGALDVSYTPIQMKKNRPAVMITVIVQPHISELLSSVLLRETTTLGIRMQQMQRRKAQRDIQQIETPFGLLSVKVKRLGTHIVSATPEYEACRRIAIERAIPLVDVYDVASRVISETIMQEEGQADH
jgi:uncharacterized protein (TIGR00299 family) protein